MTALRAVSHEWSESDLDLILRELARSCWSEGIPRATVARAMRAMEIVRPGLYLSARQD